METIISVWICCTTVTCSLSRIDDSPASSCRVLSLSSAPVQNTMVFDVVGYQVIVEFPPCVLPSSRRSWYAWYVLVSAAWCSSTASSPPSTSQRWWPTAPGLSVLFWGTPNTSPSSLSGLPPPIGWPHPVLHDVSSDHGNEVQNADCWGFPNPHW